MQFHAWINPLRIASTTIPPELDENGFYMQNYVNHPKYFMAYNSGIYYNPASAYIRNRIATAQRDRRKIRRGRHSF